MSAETNEKIALNWFEAFNEHNLEKLLSLYADDAIHFSPKLKVRRPETHGYVKGKEALREWWHDAFDRLPSLHYTVTTLTANNNRVFMEYVRSVEGEFEMLVAEVLEIENDKIVSSRVYHG
ncbi:nuclear transport factor 2 family protein [Solitalea longa]|uniref:Nuclear transport factor 2 family protein n=1 Tax=Solitalea longa TaxID=2079460 RepID=A0A2S5A6Y8_9SPHI|nr:nuclear transport factor 2 family protein [Solitalea longa]POY38360.1 nuclear transport factor 2 family protein [Solitalea longa]